MRAPGTLGAILMRRPPARCRVQTGERVAGVDEVAVLHQPLGQHPVVARADLQVLLLGADRAEPAAGGAPGCPRRRRRARTCRRPARPPPASPGCAPPGRRARSWSPGRGRRPGRPGSSPRRSRRPRSSRRASAASVPAGGSSSTAVTPRSRRVAWQRSQRTGRVTWRTSRADHLVAGGAPRCRRRWTAAAAPGRAGRARRRPPRAPPRRAPCSRCGTRRRPTAAGSLARPGGLAASAASCSALPAATIWPAPLRLAAVRPSSSIPAATSSGSPPSTADMPVGASAQAAAISRPRSRASATAASGPKTPASAAAASSPTLCPAVDDVGGCDDRQRPARRRRPGGGDEQRLGDRGVVDLLGVGRRAELDQVEPGDRGQPAQPGRRRRAGRATGRASRAPASPVRGRGEPARLLPSSLPGPYGRARVTKCRRSAL